MGKKTNPNILRLGVSKNWKTEFFEKKKKELPLYIFKDLEIQGYLERFLENKNFFIHNYSQYYSNNTLNLYISYFVPVKSSLIKNSKTKTFCLVNTTGHKKFVCYTSDNFSSNLDSIEIIDNKNAFKKMYKLKKYLKFNKFQSSYLYFNLFENSLENMLGVISNFMSNKFDIKISFSCINKDFNHLNVLKTKKIRMLRKFKFASFFKDGLELLFHVAFNKNSARLLAKFISVQLKTINRFNYFLTFIKSTLGILISSKLSTLKGVKIMLKGRLSKGPRAKHKILIIGDVAVQKFNSNIDYFQTTTHNANGSYGIKVWIVNK